MRDIRSDLQERLALMEERIGTAHAQCEEKIKQVQNERGATVAALKELFALGCAKRIRTLPDGTFALPMLSPAIGLKRVV